MEVQEKGYSRTWLMDEGIRRGIDRFNEYNLGVWKSLNYPCCPTDVWNLTAIESLLSQAARKKWITNFSRAIQAAQINIPKTTRTVAP
jgi:hypothetical protein